MNIRYDNQFCGLELEVPMSLFSQNELRPLLKLKTFVYSLLEILFTHLDQNWIQWHLPQSMPIINNTIFCAKNDIIGTSSTKKYLIQLYKLV